jgi:hypothetical protein
MCLVAASCSRAAVWGVPPFWSHPGRHQAPHVKAVDLHVTVTPLARLAKAKGHTYGRVWHTGRTLFQRHAVSHFRLVLNDASPTLVCLVFLVIRDLKLWRCCVKALPDAVTIATIIQIWPSHEEVGNDTQHSLTFESLAIMTCDDVPKTASSFSQLPRPPNVSTSTRGLLSLQMYTHDWQHDSASVQLWGAAGPGSKPDARDHTAAEGAHHTAGGPQREWWAKFACMRQRAWVTRRCVRCLLKAMRWRKPISWIWICDVLKWAPALCARDLGMKSRPDTGCTDRGFSWFSPVPLRECRGSTN